MLQNPYAGRRANNFVTATGSTTSRSLADRAADTVNILDHGAVGDDSTNNRVAIDAAVADAGPDGAYVPEGTFAVATGVVAPADGEMVLFGRGLASVIKKQAGVLVGPVYVFDGQTRLDLERIGVDFAVDTTATNGVNLFKYDYSDIRITSVTADANVEIDGVTGARNYLASFCTIPASANVSGLTVSFSKFTNFFYGLLQANNTVATTKDISFVFNEFDEFGSVALLFNAPADGALIENVQIIGNKLGANRSQQPFGSSVGYPHRGSFAGHVEYARLIGNHATGYGGELFRSEEAARGVIMALNTARLDGKDGIEIIPNNAGGTLYTPRFFSVNGNILDHRGLVSSPTKGWGLGLQTYTSISGHENAECLQDSVVHDNIVNSFSEGLLTHFGMQRNLVHHNVSVENATGLKTYAPSLGVQDTLLVSNTTAVDFEQGGILGRLHLRGTAAEGAYQPISVDAASAPGATEGWTWESGRFSVADGDTFVDLIPRGARIQGRIIATLTKDNATYCYETGQLVWDGSTLVYYRERRFAAGDPVIASADPFGLTDTDGRLAIKLASTVGSATTNCRLQVKFDGLHVWS